MSSRRCLAALLVWAGLVLGGRALRAAEGPTAGPVAEWDFNEGQGDVAHDSSGNRHDAKVGGAAWIRQGDGYAISLDGMDDYVDCGESGSMGITGPVTLEAWIKPTRKANGLACILGEGLGSFLLAYYNTEVCDLYIADGSNSVRGKLELGQWNHVAAAFDGKRLNMWINGRLTGTRESRFERYKTAGHVLIGTRGQPSLPQFKGLLDRVRLYNRAITAEEAVAHFKAEAGQYGFDPTWFGRIKVTPYYYLDRGKVVVEADYRGLQPLEGKGQRIEVKLASRDKPQTILQEKRIEPLPEGGTAEAALACAGLPAGEYVIRVALEGGKTSWPVEETMFSYPQKAAAIPSPAEKTVEPPAAPRPAPFEFAVGKGGGFTIRINEGSYAFRTRVSWPKGEFNVLGAGDEAEGKGEKSWTCSMREAGRNRWEVKAGGEHYRVERWIEVFPTHVSVKDTYVNTSADGDLGLLIYNEMPLAAGQVSGSWISGHEKRGRRADLSYPDYAPSVFVTDAHSGMGMLPIDDVFIVQSVNYVEEGAAGIGTERFALGPGQSYTLEWAVYPTGSKDYYDFINAFRRAEGRIGRVDGGFGFISFGPMNRRQMPDEDFFRKRGMKYAVISSLGRAEDDPELSIEGIEFMDFPREMELLKRQASLFHQRYPGRRIMFHVAHSLYLTNKPDERYADSKVILANGKQAVWSANEPYVSRRRQAEGWTWWIYYPAPGNSFHDALMKSVDVMMDELGMDGAFMDGFLAGYEGLWTYDGRWDGHSAEIDPATKTIRRKVGSVLLLSQPSMLEFARKIRDKGGTVIANNTVFTRSIANEKHIIFDYECASGPELHLAPNVTALMRPPVGSEQELYADMLDKLSWGMLFGYFIERINLTARSLAAEEYPMTFEEIRSGMVRGRERIVTMNSGVYGWGKDDELHLVHKFDARGSAAGQHFVTTVDGSGARTELKLGAGESAVITRIPATIRSAMPVNASVSRYDGRSLDVLLNGQGDATLDLFVGTRYPDKREGVLTDGGINPGVKGVGDAYRVKVGGEEKTIEERDGTLLVPLKLNGQTEVSIEPAR